ncbi:MAG: DNA-directed RNA polymerase subunit omega [Saprospiraceae bacterium]|jgi:DNA-directed RNA polymerase subunit K/omega|nr:DNA-directed RNA polymerase subunit omega [Saprospiraceae bacterium]MCA0334659.1 DNA-directed RNA polymerase subunit omega [Bacteroidota bacterium]MCB0604516.1 DNA-directed RNA polymerase subunit omega [Saprospiraceae bacterium]MCO5279008.1 DNA-directed RNA polymerase subunit omega [Saprospiraceae bacterium]HMT76572.1 DNA-directed RNA polymerase subunit omega [Saprospiraceae bacterium]
MTDIKTKVQGIDPNSHARDIKSMAAKTGNIYEAICVISGRARQLQVGIKKELNAKLEEFTVSSDTIEEIQENKEQIEISKFYEKLPNPAIIATEEYINDELSFRYKEVDQE